MNSKRVGKMAWLIPGLIVAVLVFPIIASAQPSVYAYRLYKAAGNAPVTALGIASEDNTNGYVVGGFNSSMNISGITLNNSSGASNVFLCKFLYGQTNAPQWIIYPVTDYNVSNARAGADASPFTGNGYIVGNFAGTNLTFGTTTITNNATDHSDDIFLVKYDYNGNLKYLLQAGGTGEDTLGDSMTDPNGNTYLTGSFVSPIFYAGTSNLVRQSTTGSDCFIIKYNNSGGVTWLNQGSYASGTCVTYDNSGDCYVGGNVLGSAVFSGTSPSNPTTTNFLAKYSSSGTLQWVRSDDPVGTHLFADRGQDVYTVGTFSNIMQFGSISLTNHSSSTIYVAKYDPNGNILWAEQIPGWGCDAVTGVVVDFHTNCWVSGYFAAPNSPSNTVAAIARYDLSGNLTGLSALKPGKISMAGGITASGINSSLLFNILICGTYSTNFSLGSSAVLNNGGNTDLFSGWIFVSPQLNLTTSSTNAVATWPSGDGSQFTLQGSADMSSWSSLGSGTLGNNGQQFYSNSAPSSIQFFRLKKN